MQTVQDAPKHTFPATFSGASWFLLPFIVLIFGVVGPLANAKGAAPDTLLNGLFIATVGAAALTFFFQFARCRVVASASALTVVQPTQRYVLPWEQVADVVVGKDGGMRILLADHSSISVMGFGGSVIGSFTGGVHAKRARDGIMEVMAHATRQKPRRPVSSASALQWKIGLMVWAALIAVCLASWFSAPHHVLM